MESLAFQDIYVSSTLIDSQYKPENKSKSAKSTTQIQNAGSSLSSFTSHSVCLGETPKIRASRHQIT